MKKIALFLTGAFLSVSTIGAIASVTDNVVVERFVDNKKTKVEKSELPEEVIQSLEQSEFQNWEIQEAYKVEDEQSGEVHYELSLASADQVQQVKFSEAGEIMRDSEMGRSDDLQQDQSIEQNQGTQDQGLDQGTQDQGMDQGTEDPATEPGTEPGSETQPGQQY